MKVFLNWNIECLLIAFCLRSITSIGGAGKSFPDQLNLRCVGAVTHAFIIQAEERLWSYLSLAHDKKRHEEHVDQNSEEEPFDVLSTASFLNAGDAAQSPQVEKEPQYEAQQHVSSSSLL